MKQRNKKQKSYQYAYSDEYWERLESWRDEERHGVDPRVIIKRQQEIQKFIDSKPKNKMPTALKDFTNDWMKKINQAKDTKPTGKNVAVGCTKGNTVSTKALQNGIDKGDTEFQIKKAKAIAQIAHKGQYRWDGKTPYFTHVEAVANKVTDKAKIVAYLHDVVEDSDVTINDLKKYFDTEITDAVNAITKQNRAVESYIGYILRVKTNPLAKQVKIADIEHNILSLDTKGDKYGKYTAALHILKN